MSSICGILNRDDQVVEPTQVGQMVDILAHWGPDATGVWAAGSVGFGHLALWSTPEAPLERAPWHLEEADIVLTADARIDNRDELRRQVGLMDRPAQSITDAELIVRAYVKWDTNCLDRLIGDFAFALWDGRKKRLFCARDPLGVRPFFYHLNPRQFLFASQIKAIFVDPAVSRELNATQIAIGLAGLQSFDDQTAYQAVRMLEPATALCLDERGVRVWKYWTLDLRREIRFARDDDYVDAFEEILQSAVNARMRATGRVGFMLSGGLDATTSLALGLHGGRQPVDQLSAFSWALREGDDWVVPDERPYIDAFLREHPIEHHYVITDAARLFDVPEVVRRHGNGPEQRIDYCQMVPTLEAARDRGVRVILEGSSGDMIASHNPNDHVLACLLRGDWETLRAEAALRAVGSGRPAWRHLAGMMRPILRPARWLAPLDFQWMFRRYCERVSDLAERGIPLRESLRDEIGLVDHVRRIARPRIPGAWRSPVRASQIYALTQTHVASDQVNAWRYSASFGVEFRSPYLDRRVVEYAVAVPPQQHRDARESRRLLRRVAQRRVPEKIAQRRDKGMTMPDLGRGLLANEDYLADRIAEWRRVPTVCRFLDLDRLETDLRWVVKNTTARSPDWAPALPLCRGVLLAKFLESIGDIT